jgi:hypothetical protein
MTRQIDLIDELPVAVDINAPAAEARPIHLTNATSLSRLGSRAERQHTDAA